MLTLCMCSLLGLGTPVGGRASEELEGHHSSTLSPLWPHEMQMVLPKASKSGRILTGSFTRFHVGLEALWGQ